MLHASWLLAWWLYLILPSCAENANITSESGIPSPAPTAAPTAAPIPVNHSSVFDKPNLRIAVEVTGQSRTLVDAFPYWAYSSILLPEASGHKVHVFMSISDFDEQNERNADFLKTMRAFLGSRLKYLEVLPTGSYEKLFWYELKKDHPLFGRPRLDRPYTTRVGHPDNASKILGQLWKFQRIAKVRRAYARNHSLSYDLGIHMRPDAALYTTWAFWNGWGFREQKAASTYVVPKTMWFAYAHSDNLLIATEKGLDQWDNLWYNLLKLLGPCCNMHPETLSTANMRRGGMNPIATEHVFFYIMRTSTNTQPRHNWRDKFMTGFTTYCNGPHCHNESLLSTAYEWPDAFPLSPHSSVEYHERPVRMSDATPLTTHTYSEGDSGIYFYDENANIALAASVREASSAQHGQRLAVEIVGDINEHLFATAIWPQLHKTVMLPELDGFTVDVYFRGTCAPHTSYPVQFMAKQMKLLLGDRLRLFDLIGACFSGKEKDKDFEAFIDSLDLNTKNLENSLFSRQMLWLAYNRNKTAEFRRDFQAKQQQAGTPVKYHRILLILPGLQFIQSGIFGDKWWTDFEPQTLGTPNSQLSEALRQKVYIVPSQDWLEVNVLDENGANAKDYFHGNKIMIFTEDGANLHATLVDNARAYVKNGWLDIHRMRREHMALGGFRVRADRDLNMYDMHVDTKVCCFLTMKGVDFVVPLPNPRTLDALNAKRFEVIQAQERLETGKPFVKTSNASRALLDLTMPLTMPHPFKIEHMERSRIIQLARGATGMTKKRLNVILSRRWGKGSVDKARAAANYDHGRKRA
jgi:hypothetical protein